MKRILGLIVVLMIAGLGTNAEGGFHFRSGGRAYCEGRFADVRRPYRGGDERFYHEK